MAREKVYLLDHSPHLLGEWSYENNPGSVPEDLTVGSDKKYWWKCLPHNHLWIASVASRKSGSGCPVCSNQKILLGFNDLKTTHPHIAERMVHPEKAETVTIGKTVKQLFRCDSGHIYSTIPSLVEKGHACRYCARLEAYEGETDIGTTDPDVARFLLNPEDARKYLRSSGKVVKWICDLGHITEARIADRTNGRGCAVCTNRIVLSGFNDLLTIRPDLASEIFDSSVIAEELAPQSNKLVTWICEAEHTWSASVSNRFNGRGCPKCTTRQSSNSERRLGEICTEVFDQVTYSDNLLPLNVPWGSHASKARVDVLAGNLIIEYDGEYYHKKRMSKDIEKTTALIHAGYFVARIRENGLEHLPLNSENLFQISVRFSYKDDNLIDAVEQIKQWLDTTTKDKNDKQ